MIIPLPAHTLYRKPSLKKEAEVVTLGYLRGLEIASLRLEDMPRL